VGRLGDGGAAELGWATSRDAGRTWRAGRLDAAFPAVSDPVVAYDAVHRTWLISFLALTGGSVNVFAAGSSDGTSWRTPVPVAIAPSPENDYDKEWIVCDNGADPGYTLENGLLVESDLDAISASPADGLRTYGALVDRLRALPGVHAATLASIVPFGEIREGRLITNNSKLLFTTYTVVGTDYLETLGLKLLAGRQFTRLEERSPAASPVALVDRTLIDRLFGGGNPIGQVLHLSMRPDRADDEAVEIVGVVPAIRDDMTEELNAHVYVPFGARYRSAMTLRIKTDPGAETAVTIPIRQTIAEIDRRVPVLSIQTLTEHRDASGALLALTLISGIFGTLGVIALFLASVGVYGLRAYLVAQRTREFGIRLALGAPRGSMVRQVVWEGSRIAVAGMAIGTLLAAGLTIVLQQSGMLLEVSPTDPLVVFGAPLVLLAATGLASYLPARRALRVEPVAALRVE